MEKRGKKDKLHGRILGKRGWATIEESSIMLSASEATVRNWIRSGIIPDSSVSEDRSLVRTRCLRKLLDDMSSGKSTRLRSRRNKNHVPGAIVAKKYAMHGESASSVERIVSSLDGATLTEMGSRFVLSEYALRLMKSRGLVSGGGDKSLLRHFLDGILDAGPYGCLIRDLIGVTDGSDCHMPSGDVLGFDVQYRESEDFLGLLYMSLTSIGRRRSKGAYYTPMKVVCDMIGGLGLGDAESVDSSVMDPCCGTGNFLICAYREKSAASGSIADAGKLIGTLHGRDTDMVSVAIARINMALASGTSDVETLYRTIVCEDSITGLRGSSFDFVVGNPPWGMCLGAETEKNARERLSISVGRTGKLESFHAFSLLFMDILEDGGSMAIVLPEAFMSVRTHEPLRHAMASKGTFTRVSYLDSHFDGVFTPSVFVIMKKRGDMSQDSSLNAGGSPVWVTRGSESYFVDGGSRLKSGAFDFHINDEELAVIEMMENSAASARLKGNAVFALGIVTGDNGKFLTDSHTGESEPILRGCEVERYGTKAPEKRIRYIREELRQSAPESIYRAGEKLVYRFIGDRIVAAYDDSGMLTLNSCNIVIPKIDDVDIKYVLAVLNSAAATFYFRKRFKSLKVLRTHLEAIPIPLAGKDTMSGITELVDDVMRMKSDGLDPAFIIEVIDEAVMDAFGMSDCQKALVRSMAL